MFRPRWLRIPDKDQWCLGDGRVAGALGVDTLLGARVLDHQSTFRLVLGPLSKMDFDRLLPPASGIPSRNGLSYRRLCAIVRKYTRDQFFWEIQYLLKGAEVPPLELPGAAFTPQSIVDLQGLVSRLTDPSEALSAFLTQRFSSATRGMLEAYSGEDPSGHLRTALANDLNRLVRDGSIYDQERFVGVLLRSETARLLAQKPSGPELCRLNRLLIEDAYPLELDRGRRLGFDTWLCSERPSDDTGDLVLDPDRLLPIFSSETSPSAFIYAGN
jgi:hypothetical protein